MGYVLALAVEILQQVEGFDKYDKMIEGLTNVFEAAENAANSARKSAKEFAEKYKDAPSSTSCPAALPWRSLTPPPSA